MTDGENADRKGTMTRIALLEQSLMGIDDKLRAILGVVEKFDARLAVVERREFTCAALAPDMPLRLREMEARLGALERWQMETQGAIKLAKWAGGGGGLLGGLALLAELLKIADKIK